MREEGGSPKARDAGDPVDPDTGHLITACPLCGLGTLGPLVLCFMCFDQWKAHIRSTLVFAMSQAPTELDAFETVWKLGGLHPAVDWLDANGLGFAGDMRVPTSSGFEATAAPLYRDLGWHRPPR